VEKEKLEVEDHDIEEYIELQARLTGEDPALIRREVIKNDNIKFYLLEKKVFDLILDFAVTTEISFEDYHKKIEEDLKNHKC